MVIDSASSSDITHVTDSHDTTSSISRHSPLPPSHQLPQHLNSVTNSPSLFSRCFDWLNCLHQPSEASDTPQPDDTEQPAPLVAREAALSVLAPTILVTDKNLMRSFEILGPDNEWEKGSFLFAKNSYGEESLQPRNFYHRAYHRLVEKLVTPPTEMPLPYTVSICTSPDDLANSSMTDELLDYPVIQFTEVNSEEKLSHLYRAMEHYLERISTDTASKQRMVMVAMMSKIKQHLCQHPPGGLTPEQIESASAPYPNLFIQQMPAHKQDQNDTPATLAPD